MLHVDTPERGEVDYTTATNLLKKLTKTAAKRDPEGRLALTSFKTGKYGRWLGVLSSVDHIVDINGQLSEQWPND